MEVARSNILVVVFLIIFIIYLFIFFIYLFFAVFDEGLSLLHRQKTDICCRRHLKIINFITSCNLLTTCCLPYKSTRNRRKGENGIHWVHSLENK